MATCPDPDVLAALLADELPAPERAPIVDHAATCQQCRAVIALVVDEADVAHAPTVASASSGGAVVITLGVGQHVDRYVIEQKIGAGGMGVVYAAIDSELQRKVAVKLVRPPRDDNMDSQGRERLLREARTLARLSHPNVVTVFDVGVHGDHLWVAMELVDGGSLSAWLRRAPRAVNDIVDRMIETGKGLAAAHAAGVVHRDVKPDNILVGEDGRARVTDFGLARTNDAKPVATAPVMGAVPETQLTMTDAIVGTPIYMAPEQLDGASADARSDQWSFCATLYEALAGVRPFPIDAAIRRAAIHEGRLAEPLAGRRVPGWLRRIVVRGLRVAPDQRWPSVAAIVEALVHGRGRRRRYALAVAGFAAFAVGVVAIALALRDPPVRTVHRPYVTVDTRGGACDCPYSPCTERGCLGQCNAHTYEVGSRVPGIGTDSSQEALFGASADGNAILYASGAGCALDRMLLARRHGAIFVPVDITERVLARIGGSRILEGSATLAPDGRSLIIREPDKPRFVRVRLGPGDEIVSVDGSEFAEVLPEAPIVVHPVMSADELAFFYVVREVRDSGLAGIYTSVRTDVNRPFPRGGVIKAARNYNYASGVSADGLTLFLENNEFATRVLVRASTAEAFGPPAPTIIPYQLHGWRAVSIEGCKRILTTGTPGGCAQEDIIYLDAVRRAPQ